MTTGLEREITDRASYERTIELLRGAGIRLPRIDQLANPETLPGDMLDSLAAVDPDAADPRNLFRVHWYNDATRAGLAEVPEHIVLPSELTGVDAAIIVVADHGGESGNDSHYDRELSDNYTIPFVVWAPGVGVGGDLYAHNPTNRSNPGSAQIGLDGTQPIRAHEAGNLALDLLGLPAIPGSVFNAGHDLELR